MTFLSKQKGFVPLVLMIAVGLFSFVGGFVVTKAVDNHEDNQNAEQVQTAQNTDVGVK